MPDLTAAVRRLREDAAYARTLDEHLDGHERPYNPADPTDPAVVAQRCDLTADLLDAHARYLALLEAHANAAGLRDHELAERIRLRASAKDEIDAALGAFAAAILPTTEGTQR